MSRLGDWGCRAGTAASYPIAVEPGSTSSPSGAHCALSYNDIETLGSHHRPAGDLKEQGASLSGMVR